MKKNYIDSIVCRFGFSAVLAAALAVANQSVEAETLDWVGTGTDGTWQTASNWSPAQTPVNNDTVNIGAGDTVKFNAADWKWQGTVNISDGGTLDFDHRARVTSDGGAQGYYVLLGGAGFTQTGGTVRLGASNVSLGYGANNHFTYNMTGGSFTNDPETADYFRLGSSSWGGGGGQVVNMNVSGDSTFSVKQAIISQGNTATLTFSGNAAATFSQALWIAYGGTGTLNLGTADLAYNGTADFSQNTTYVGQDSGNAKLNIYGGNNTFKTLVFANKTTTTSAGLIAGGTTNVTDMLIGNATVNQTAGSLTVTNLTLGKNGDGSAAQSDKESLLQIAGGTFTGKSDGTINLGFANATTKFVVSDSGQAIFNGTLNMGNAGTTNVTISGGSLTANGKSNLGVAGTTNVTISGGSLTANGESDLGVAGTTNVTISGGSLTTKGTTAIGKTGTTSWTITGGTAEFQGWTDFGKGADAAILVKDAGAVTICDVTAVGRDKGTSSFTVGTGGKLTSSGAQDFHISVSAGKGSLVVDGGTLDLSASKMLSVGSINWNASEAAIFQVKGGSATISQLIVGGYSTDGSRGLAKLSGGTTTVNNDTIVGRYLKGDGTARGLGTLEISGTANATIKGALTIGQEKGKGNATISGGTTTVNGLTYLGKEAGSEGSMTVSNSATKVNLNQQLIVGQNGTGALSITDGTFVINSYAYPDNSKGSGLGFESGSTGSLTISGGSMSYNVNGDFWLGRGGTGAMVIEGTGIFNQQSGNFVVGGQNSSFTMRDSAKVTIPYLSLSQSGNNATADISGGTLKIANGFRVGVNGSSNASAVVSGTSQITSGYVETLTNGGTSGNAILTIEGSAVDWTITGANNGNALNIRPVSTIKYLADKNGVSALKSTGSGNVVISGNIEMEAAEGLFYTTNPTYTLATVNTGTITCNPESLTAGWSWELSEDSKQLLAKFQKTNDGAHYIDFETKDSDLGGLADSGWMILESAPGQDILFSLTFPGKDDLSDALAELNADLQGSGLTARQEDSGRAIISGTLANPDGTLFALNNAYFSAESGLKDVSWQAVNGVPEPSSVVLLLVGLLGLGYWRRKR